MSAPSFNALRAHAKMTAASISYVPGFINREDA
jgi:hypothetical protein